MVSKEYSEARLAQVASLLMNMKPRCKACGHTEHIFYCAPCRSGFCPTCLKTRMKTVPAHASTFSYVCPECCCRSRERSPG